MDHDLSLKETQKEWHGTLKSYLIGFILSLLLTTASFSLVAMRFFSKKTLTYTVIGLALVQFIVQLFFFLHLGREEKPRWGLWAFCFMVMTLLIIVIGSLWVMYHLNERVMPEM